MTVRETYGITASAYFTTKTKISEGFPAAEIGWIFLFTVIQYTA
jgi:hypothetical protein